MQSLANVLIRPNRETYKESDLGPELFLMKSVLYRRKDVQISNQRGQILKCSWFYRETDLGKFPVVIYCHGNCGSQTDAFDLLDSVLTLGMSLFWFDFSGSGQSDGEYISLGYYEQWDIKTVVDYLRQSERISSISLWGRSMGAASIIMYCANDPNIASIILDSPFAVLNEICQEIAKSYRLIPSPLIKYFLGKVRTKIREVAKFDIFDVNPIAAAPSCTVPAIFIHAIEDELIQISHMRRVYDRYGGSKSKIEVTGGHNSVRPDDVIETACKHIYQNNEQHGFSILGAMTNKQILSPCPLHLLKDNRGHSESDDFDIDDEEEPTEKTDTFAQLPQISSQFQEQLEQHTIMHSGKTRADMDFDPDPSVYQGNEDVEELTRKKQIPFFTMKKRIVDLNTDR